MWDRCGYMQMCNQSAVRRGRIGIDDAWSRIIAFLYMPRDTCRSGAVRIRICDSSALHSRCNMSDALPDVHLSALLVCADTYTPALLRPLKP